MPVDEQEVESVADAEAVELRGHEGVRELDGRGAVDVEHAAAVGVGEGPDAVPRGLGAERAGGLPGAPQDDQRDQAGLAHQRDGALAPRVGDERTESGSSPAPASAGATRLP